MKPKHPITGLALLAGLALTAPAQAADADAAGLQQKLEQQVDRMGQELELLKQQLQQLKTQNEALANQQQQQAAQLQATAAPASGIPPDLSLWGYGEIYYTHPTHDSPQTRFDLARAVFGIGYRFDDRTSFNSEFEVEHAVASASDQGEFEVEQFYIDRQLNDAATARVGLMLMPFGLINEHHEPDAFYGVQRNFVETLIIPSTWREGGAAVHGTTDAGLRWDAGLTTGINIAGWNTNPEDPQYRSALELIDADIAPMQATHQELQFANAQHLSQYLSLGYAGIPGLTTGAAVFTGLAALPQTPVGLPDERVTLWEAHARWTPGPFDLSALYARGTLSGTAAYNIANSGTSNPLPSRFDGWYLQGAYRAWQQGDLRLMPFVRLEHYDMGASYDGLAPGFSAVPTGLASDGKPWPQPRDRVWTTGANFYLTPHLVLKADYQHFDVNNDFSRVDLGLGLSF